MKELELKEELIKLRRHIHHNPEIGLETYNTAKFVYEYLEKIGYKNIKYVVNKAGVLCYLDNNKEETILLRTDIDALPIKEQYECEYKSKNDYMHACGHDAHCSMMLIASKMIYEIKDELNYNVLFVFQPAEEGPLPGGALKVIPEIEQKNIIACFACHVTNDLESGKIGIKRAEAFSAPDLFEGSITGKGCHAAKPEEGCNPLYPMGEVALAFNEENKHYPNDNVVISITHIDGGRAKNVIPDKVFFEGTARSFKEETRHELEKNLTNITESIAAKYGAKGHFDFLYAYDPVYNEPCLVDYIKSIAPKADLEFVELEKPTKVGEDFSFYRRLAPACMTWFGVYNKKNKREGLHSPSFTLDEDALINGAKLHTAIVKNFKKEYIK